MSGIFGALTSAAQSLRVLEKELTVVQNNVTNSQTPGYVRQFLQIKPQPFDPNQDLPGGLLAGDLISTRNSYAEQAVRFQQNAFGKANQRVADLAELEAVFEITEDAGIPAALSSLFQSFSQLSVSPNDTLARRLVLDRAAAAAGVFRDTATNLINVSNAASQQVTDTGHKINHIVTAIRDLNVQRRYSAEAAKDAGLDARLYAALEELAEYVEFTSLPQPDGSVSIFLGGQVPALIGGRQYVITGGVVDDRAHVYDEEGNDITDLLTSGRLGALIESRNSTIPASQASLNRLAETLADRINSILASGVDLNGVPPSRNLFEYQNSSDAAFSLRVTGLTPAELAAAGAASPGGNGVALTLAALSNAKEIDGYTWAGFYGNIASNIGRALENSRDDQQSRESMLAHARVLRQDLSGVDLDTEAAHLVELQRNYQAMSQFVGVLNELTQNVLAMIR